MLIMYTTKSNVTWIPIIPDVNMTSPAPTPWSSMKHPSRYWKSFTTQLVHTLDFSVTQQAGYQPVSITRNNQKHSLMENCPRGCFSTTMLAVWCIVCCSVCAWQTPAHTAKNSQPFIMLSLGNSGCAHTETMKNVHPTSINMIQHYAKSLNMFQHLIAVHPRRRTNLVALRWVQVQLKTSAARVSPLSHHGQYAELWKSMPWQAWLDRGKSGECGILFYKLIAWAFGRPHGEELR